LLPFTAILQQHFATRQPNRDGQGERVAETFVCATVWRELDNIRYSDKLPLLKTVTVTI
jgi:hypothetical protein